MNNPVKRTLNQILSGEPVAEQVNKLLMEGKPVTWTPTGYKTKLSDEFWKTVLEGVIARQNSDSGWRLMSLRNKYKTLAAEWDMHPTHMEEFFVEFGLRDKLRSNAIKDRDYVGKSWAEED